MYKWLEINDQRTRNPFIQEGKNYSSTFEILINLLDAVMIAMMVIGEEIVAVIVTPTEEDQDLVIVKVMILEDVLVVEVVIEIVIMIEEVTMVETHIAVMIETEEQNIVHDIKVKIN